MILDDNRENFWIQNLEENNNVHCNLNYKYIFFLCNKEKIILFSFESFFLNKNFRILKDGKHYFNEYFKCIFSVFKCIFLGILVHRCMHILAFFKCI